MERKVETFIYEGLGFPIELIDTPMKKVFGEWVIDVDMNALQMFVFKGLVHKLYPLTGGELKFMRKFLRMSTTEFGEQVGVTHAAVLKWEKEQAKIAPAQEIYIRMFLLNCLKNQEILNFFGEITPKTLTQAKDRNSPPFPVDIKHLKKAS